MTWSGTDPASQTSDICFENLSNPSSNSSQVERLEIWTRHWPNMKQETRDRGIAWRLLYGGEIHGTEFVSNDSK
jgi:hypothetical protein